MPAERIPRIDTADMTPRQREFYDVFAAGRRAEAGNSFRLVDEAGNLIGPVRAWVVQAELGMALQELGGQMRWGLGVSDRVREAVILVVAYAEDSPFELFAHEGAGRAAGFDDADLAAIRDGGEPAGADAAERTALALARELVATGGLTDESYAAAVATFTLPVVVELVTLVGYYRLVALQLRAFQILPPAS